MLSRQVPPSRSDFSNIVKESIPSRLSWIPRHRPEKPEPMIAIRRVAEFLTGIVQTSWRGARSFLESMRRDLIVDPFFGICYPGEIDGLLSLAPENFPSPGRGVQSNRISLVLVNAIAACAVGHILLLLFSRGCTAAEPIAPQ